jgi:CBS domain-containing protein
MQPGESMNVQSIMTPRPRVCSAGVPLAHAARLMLEQDVGEIPVTDGEMRPIGVITDRDIVLRCVAVGGNAQDATVESCMTAPAQTVRDDATLEECAQLMARHRIRRVPIVDANGAICGIVAQADLEATDARSLKQQVAERVSTPH